MGECRAVSGHWGARDPVRSMESLELSAESGKARASSLDSLRVCAGSLKEPKRKGPKVKKRTTDAGECTAVWNMEVRPSSEGRLGHQCLHATLMQFLQVPKQKP